MCCVIRGNFDQSDAANRASKGKKGRMIAVEDIIPSASGSEQLSMQHMLQSHPQNHGS
jgi:hypothetical protein